MLDALVSAFANITSGVHLLYLFGGVFLGLAIGVFPGLGGIVGMSLLMPFLYGMDQVSAIAMLIGMVAVIPTSDTFTSVLMGIPGSSASQATVLDGFPLAKQGHAAKALGAAFSASLFGGLFGALVLTAFVLIARPLILAFGSAELFMLGILGLSMVGVLAGSSIWKGLAACGLGLLIGSIGGAPATGEERMSFNISYLIDGIPLVVVGLGIFAVPEIVDLLRQRRSVAGTSSLGSGWLDGFRDMIRYRWLCLRCASIGTIVGALPGLGGSVVDWIAYGHVVQTSKDKSKFGQGDIRGVLAPESANNAKEGGGLVPTLLFGIPGSGSMAVFLGGMVLLGLEPGPSMVGSQLDITYTIVWSLALANVIGAGSCLFLSPYIARLTTIRYVLMAPFMVMVITFAAFQATRDLGDLLSLAGVGILGIYMKRFGWPRPALLIGFVLADNVETYLYQALQFYEWSFLTRPIVLIVGAITLISIWMGARKKPADQSGTTQPLRSRATDLKPQVCFALTLAGFFAFALFDAFLQSFLGGVFTGGVALVMLPMSLWIIFRLLRGEAMDPMNYDHEVEDGFAGDPDRAHLYYYMYWLGGFILSCMTIGYLMSLVGFFMAFLYFEARLSWPRILLLTGLSTGFMVSLAKIMVLDFPPGLLQSLVELPWPFR